MIKTLWSTAATCVLLVVIGMLAGCGSGSGSTSGTLTVADIATADLGGGTYSVSTSATFAPSSGTALPGTEIKYTATFAATTTTSRTGTLYTDSTGKVDIGPWQVAQDTTVPTILTVTATTGGLSSTKITSIPVISPLSVSPQAVGFPSSDTVGATQTVAITGGFSPYVPSSAAPGDIGVSVSGATVTITKLTASGATNTTTSVTITDNKGNQQIVTVGYYK
jgi:hypothetical protein